MDVSLEREGVSIACEVSVSTSGDQELGNVRKCLAAGYDDVVVVSSERKALQRIRGVVRDEVSEEERERIHFLTPEELFVYLEEVEARMAGGEETIRGYRVKVTYEASDPETREEKRKAISQVLARAARRLRTRSDE